MSIFVDPSQDQRALDATRPRRSRETEGRVWGVQPRRYNDCVSHRTPKGNAMYIGIGTVVVILIILLLIGVLR